MSLSQEIVQYRARLATLETDMVGQNLRIEDLRNKLKAQISGIRQNLDLSPEAIGDIALRLVAELTVLKEKHGEAVAIREALGLGK